MDKLRQTETTRRALDRARLRAKQEGRVQRSGRARRPLRGETRLPRVRPEHAMAMSLQTLADVFGLERQLVTRRVRRDGWSWRRALTTQPVPQSEVVRQQGIGQGSGKRPRFQRRQVEET